jgi:DNA-binding transcriptional LysR family regulator
MEGCRASGGVVLITLQQLKYFIAVVNGGSISKAAESLFIAQPSLSAAVKELESETGVELFRRTARGISLTNDGAEFLGYARQVVEQAGLLEERYLNKKPPRRLCAISTQHYAFAVNAFVNMVKKTDADEYEFTLRETRTYEIINDVKTLSSELGILYMSPFNRKVLQKILHDNGLTFRPLFTAKPHIFVGAANPLARKEAVTLKDLEDYPCLTFDQGEHNSFYFSEELLSTAINKKSIRVSDRATIFNLMIGLNGYTVSTGIVSADLNGDNIKSVPLLIDDSIEVGCIVNSAARLTAQASMYLDELKHEIAKYNIN